MTPEGKVKQRIKELLKAMDIYYHMPVQNGMGAPTLDFICCVAGHYVGIEAKRDGEVPTMQQSKTMKQITESGGTCFAVLGEGDIPYLRAALLSLKEYVLCVKALEK